MTAGRQCPLAYRYRPDTLCRAPEPVSADVLYVVGGLYGNIQALDEIERMVALEQQRGRRVELVFNGDFNWFNACDELFVAINRRVLQYRCILGNVDYELAQPTPGAGCGCAYPEAVDQGVVDRSNRIMTRLQAVAARHPALQSRLRALPRYRCLMFGGLKVLVLHGDPESLAGWGLAHDAFAAGNDPQLGHWFQTTGADVIACTHTCLPVLWSGSVGRRTRLVANNGAAGMGNLRGDPRGLITRIGASEPVVAPVAGLERDGLRVSLVPVDYDRDAWLASFDRLWPAGSPAALSYRQRLLAGTSLDPDDLLFPAKS